MEMKKSGRLLIGTAIAISFAAGLLIGISINRLSPKETNIVGTMGKASNRFNIKVEDNDIKLRSELLSNETLLKSYQQTFAYHYNTSVKLCKDIDFAINAAEIASPYNEEYPTVIENLKKFRENLEKSRESLLLTVNTLHNLSEAQENNITVILNNANNALTLVNYKQAEVHAFVESVEKFILANNPYLFPDLISAHDLLSINQLIVDASNNNSTTASVSNRG
jgi:hypothetical protein